MTTHEKKSGRHFQTALFDTPWSGRIRPTAGIMVRVLGLGLLAACLFNQHVNATQPASLGVQHWGAADATLASPLSSPAVQKGKHAQFDQEIASDDARQVADWIVDSNDNEHLPFLIVDKKNAKAFVFGATGQIQGAAAVLLGMASGDDSVPGIGQRKLSTIRPDERTTPAGRFNATLARNLHGQEILWVDYDAAISLHRVITSNRKEQRAERLASLTTEDNRISFGCINVPVKFYEQVVSPLFKKANGIVYVLPETRSSRETFGSYDDVEEHALQALKTASGAAKGSLPVERTIKLR